MSLGICTAEDPTLAERFARKVRFGGFLNCWEWSGATVTAKNSPGYRWGVIRAFGRAEKASRIAWMLNRWAIPAGQNVLHSCDNPLCVNPGHLFLGSQRQNVEDMDRKGRRRSRPPVGGAGHHNARLTSAQVIEARSSSETADCLAARFGVSGTTIRNIRRGLVRRNG